MPRLKDLYLEQVVLSLQKELGYRNVMRVPRLDKIVVNVGLGEALQNAKALDAAVEDMATITGQRPKMTRAKKSIANFKLRAGQPLGCKVTLRGKMMYEFFDRLVTIAAPRIRDFRGLPTNSFDGRGNYTFGLVEQVVFPDTSGDAGDDWAMQVLADHMDDMSVQEIKVAVEDLSPEQQAELVALMWLGRGDYALEEWGEASAEALDRCLDNGNTAGYLLAHPMVSDHLEEGLIAHGYSCED